MKKAAAFNAAQTRYKEAARQVNTCTAGHQPPCRQAVGSAELEATSGTLPLVMKTMSPSRAPVVLR
jgi:hypothetical protein